MKMMMKNMNKKFVYFLYLIYIHNNNYIMNIFIVDNVKNVDTFQQNENINTTTSVYSKSDSFQLDFDDSSTLPTLSKEKMAIQKKKKLIDVTKNLSPLEYHEIFNILETSNCPYSDNNNGIFVNLHNVNEDTIDKIFDFLDFIKKKKEELHMQDNYLENMKKEIEETQDTKNQEESFSFSSEYTNEMNFKKIDEELIHEEENINIDDYLCFSSDDENNLEDKLNIKKKKNKYTGKKAKLIKSMKDMVPVSSQT